MSTAEGREKKKEKVKKVKKEKFSIHHFPTTQCGDSGVCKWTGGKGLGGEAVLAKGNISFDLSPLKWMHGI